MRFCCSNEILPAISPGHEFEKSLLRGLRFFCIFEKSGKNEATDLAVSQLWGSTIAIISAYVPGQHMWASAGHRGQGPSSSSPRQWKLDGCVKIYNSVRARSPLTKSKKKKLWRAQQYKKRSCQCTDGLSATQNGRGAAERFSTHQESNPYRPTHCDSP